MITVADLKVLPTPHRLRERQDPARWPPGMTSDQIEEAIDARCGCSGGWKCNCVSVFNQTLVKTWTEHNASTD